MTNDQFLDNEKSRGVLVYRCTACDFRGMGAAVTYHDAKPGHQCYNEDKPPEGFGLRSPSKLTKP